MRNVVLLLALALPVPAAAQAPESPEDMARRLVSVASIVGGDVQWLPGERLLYQSGGNLFSIAAAGGQPVPLASNLRAQIPRVAPKGDQVAYLSDKSGSPELWIWETGGKDVQLTRLGARINAFSWAPDGSAIAFSALRYGQFDIWTVAVPSGEVRRLTTDPRYETYPSWTPDSRSIVYVRADDRWADHDILVMPATGGPSRTVVSDRDFFDYGTLATNAKFGYPIVSPDGGTVLFRSHRSGWINYWAVPLAGGAPRPIAPETADQSDARFSPDGQQVAFISNRNGTLDIRAVGLTGPARVVVSLDRGVTGNLGWSPDGRSLSYTMATSTQPADLFVAPAAGGPPRRLTTSMAASTIGPVVTPEKVTYPSDSFTIAAYLYRPPALPAGARAPGIMLIHGGPTSQFSDTWSAQAQFLAQQGFVVMLPNIRGSSGYGKVFEDANNPCWTHCDLRDVLAGVEYLKRLPYVNAARMGITGNSYGGIMSMGAVAHAPGIFQAAVPQSGYADWISFQDYNAELQHTKLLAYEWGPWPDSAAVYRRNSSIFSADRVTTPVFLIHGTGQSPDWRPAQVPIPASTEFALALEKHFKVVKIKGYPGDSYYVSGRENARQVLLDMLAFLNLYLKDGVTGPDVPGRTSAELNRTPSP